MDFASNLGFPDKVSWRATDCATTPSSPSSTLSSQNYQNRTSNTPLTSSTSSPHASLPANKSADLSRLLTSGLKRSSSILSTSLFRSKTRAGKQNDVNPESPPKTLKARPHIPVRPSERLYKRSLLELGSDNASTTGRKETEEPLASLPKVPGVSPRQIQPRSEPQLGDTDPDKRCKAFVRIRPEGWLKVIPKQWVEDEFSGDEACTEDSRSVYSQGNSGNWTKPEDSPLLASLYPTDPACKNGPTSTPAFGAHDIPRRYGSQWLSLAQHRTGSVRHKQHPGSGHLPDHQANGLVPALLRPATRKNRLTIRPEAKQFVDQAVGISNNATSRRSSWTSVLCDSQTETECTSQYHGRYNATRCEKHSGMLHASGRNHLVHEELADGIDVGQDKLMADIDEILDLYLTSGHKLHGTKGKMPSKPTSSVERNLTPDNLRAITGCDFARTHMESVDHHCQRENHGFLPGNQHRTPSAPANHLDLSLSQKCALDPPPRSKLRVTGDKDYARGSTRRPEEEHTPKYGPTHAQAHAYQGAQGSHQDESRKPTNALKAGSPPATAAVTFLDGNGKTWI